MSGTKNKIEDLNNHLFMQLERLGNEDLAGEALKEEVERSKALTNVAGKAVDNYRLALDVQKAHHEFWKDTGQKLPMPKMLESN